MQELRRKININGEDFLLAVSQHGDGPPVIGTLGKPGVLYLNTKASPERLYICTAANVEAGVYTWRPIEELLKISVSGDAAVVPGADGEDGITPHIGENGNWYLGDTDTGVRAAGTDGENGGYYSPEITPNEADNSFTITFKASKEGMPAVTPATIKLPEVSNDSGENAAQAVYALALSEAEVDAQANSDAITKAVAEHKNVMLVCGDYPVKGGIVIDSGELDMNHACLRNVDTDYVGAIILMQGESPTIRDGRVVGGYHVAHDDTAYVWREDECAIRVKGVNNARVAGMDLSNTWGGGIAFDHVYGERVQVLTAAQENSGAGKCRFITDPIAIPDGYRYVSAVGNVGYYHIFSVAPVRYVFKDEDDTVLTDVVATPRIRVAVPAGAATVVITTTTPETELIPYFVYFTQFAEGSIVENTHIHHCHQSGIVNPVGPTVITGCSFEGIGKPFPECPTRTGANVGAIDIEDQSCPEFMMSNCWSNDCQYFLLFGGYNGTVTNCHGDAIGAYRGWNLMLSNCTTTRLYTYGGGTKNIHTSGVHATVLGIDEACESQVHGDISTAACYACLDRFDSFAVLGDNPSAVSELLDGVLVGTIQGRSLAGTASKGIIPRKGSRLRIVAPEADSESAGASMAKGDSWGIEANAPWIPCGYTIRDSVFTVSSQKCFWNDTGMESSGVFENCVFNLTQPYFDDYNSVLDPATQPTVLTFRDCAINNDGVYLFNYSLLEGSTITFENCTVSDKEHIIADTTGVTIRFTDGTIEDAETIQKEVVTTVSVGSEAVVLDGTAPEQVVNLAWAVDGARTVPPFTNYYIERSSISYPRAFDTSGFVQFWSATAAHGNAAAYDSAHKYFHAMRYSMDADSTATIHATREVLSGSGWWYAYSTVAAASAVSFALSNSNTGTGVIDYVYCIDITAMQEAGLVAEGITLNELVELFGELPLVPGENYPGGTIGDGTATLSINRGGEITTVDNTVSTATVKGGDILSVEGGSVTFMLKVIKTVAADEVGKWEGIKWVASGDSLTDGSINADTKYHQLIAEATGITVVDMGKGGTGYWRTNESGTAFYQRMANVPADADIITIFGSVNDWKITSNNVEVGAAADTIEAGTLAGYINECINVAIEKAPYAQIALVTPLDYHGINDDTMEEIANIIVAVARHRKIKCLDLYHESGFRVDDPTFAAVYTTDYSDTAGTYGHPSNLAHEQLIAPEFMQLLRRMIL